MHSCMRKTCVLRIDIKVSKTIKNSPCFKNMAGYLYFKKFSLLKQMNIFAILPSKIYN